jgi:hypothetical protein
VRRPWTTRAATGTGTGGLSHFLLDGHHKLQAAAEIGAQLQLLSMLSIDASLADAEKITAIPALRAQQPEARTKSARHS